MLSVFLKLVTEVSGLLTECHFETASNVMFWQYSATLTNLNILKGPCLYFYCKLDHVKSIFPEVKPWQQ